MQASLQRDIVRIQSAPLLLSHSKEQVVTRRVGTLRVEKKGATHAGSQSINSTLATRAQKMMRAEMTSLVVESHVALSVGTVLWLA